MCKPSLRWISPLKSSSWPKKALQLTKDVYSDLTPWQITKIARHADRPYTLDYVREISTHFVELHGDRHFSDDMSIVGGLA